MEEKFEKLFEMVLSRNFGHLVHGWPVGRDGQRHADAWLEIEDEVVLEDGRSLEKEIFYSQGDITQEFVLKMTPRMARWMAASRGHMGPWYIPPIVPRKADPRDAAFDNWRSLQSIWKQKKMRNAEVAAAIRRDREATRPPAEERPRIEIPRGAGRWRTNVRVERR